MQQIRKNIDTEQALTACEIVRKSGIKIRVFFQIGFPQETEESLRDTIALIKKIKCNRIIYSIFTPYPNTEAYEMCRQFGLIGEEFDTSLYFHQSSMNCFTPHIDKKRFRELASQIERMVDRKNSLSRLKELFSLSSLERASDVGIASALKEFGKIVQGK